MYPQSSEGLNKETDEAVYFYTPAFDALNNFSAHTVEIWGRRFPTAEHAYQWRKFAGGKPAIAKRVFNAKSPEEAQRIAHEHKKEMPRDWHEKKAAVMEEILRAKLAQHADVRDVLRRSAKRNIVENSPIDMFWGSGPKGDGKNMMGVLWIKIRNSEKEKADKRPKKD